MIETSPDTGHMGLPSHRNGSPPPPVSLIRRLACALYDALLLVAVLFFATALLLPFTGGDAVEPGSITYAVYLCFWALAYFVWPWVNAGQTLGMRAWRVVVLNRHGQPISRRQGMVRAGAALLSWTLLGLGFWWALTRADRRTWHDLVSGTHLERNV